MQNNHPKFKRRSLRLPNYDYSQPGAYFITICSWQRACLFGKVIDGIMHLNQIGGIARDQWLRLGLRFPHSDIYSYIIMPNHMHGIIVINSEISDTPESLEGSTCTPLAQTHCARKHVSPGSLGAIVRAYKASVSWYIHALGGFNRKPIWQRNYYEHIIRDEQELQTIHDYIETNPQTWEQDRLFTSMI